MGCFSSSKVVSDARSIVVSTDATTARISQINHENHTLRVSGNGSSGTGRRCSTVDRTSRESSTITLEFKKPLVIKDEPGWVFSIAALRSDVFVTSSADSQVRVWSATSGECLHAAYGHEKWARAVAGLYGYDLFVTASDDCTLKLWMLAGGYGSSVSFKEVHTLKGHTDKVISAAMLPHGVVVSGSDDRTLRVWQASTGTCDHILDGHDGWIHTVAALGSGLVASGSQDKRICIWRVDTGLCVHTLDTHAGEVRCVAALPGDEPRFVSASNDATIRIWFVDTGECAFTLQGHSERVTCVTVLEEGLIVSGSGDSTLIVWNVDTGECLQVLEGHTQLVASVAAVGQGFFVSGSADQTMQIWCASLAGKPCEPMNLLCSVERQASALLIMSKVDLCIAASLLRPWSANQSCGEILGDLAQKAVIQACSNLQASGKKKDEKPMFSHEATVFEKSHPELQTKDGGACLCAFTDVDARMATFSRCSDACPLWFLASLGMRLKAVLNPDATATIQSAVCDRLKWAANAQDLSCLRYVVLLAKHLQCLDLLSTTEGESAMKALQIAASLPATWDIHAMVLDHGDRLVAKKEVGDTEILWQGMQELLNKTFVAKYTVDRRMEKVPARLELCRLFCVQNEALWRGYAKRRLEISKTVASWSTSPFTNVKTSGANSQCFPCLDTFVEEHWLWHGTSHAAVKNITMEDFKIKFAGTKAGMLYGPGVYLAECCSKSDEYTEPDESGCHALLLCRATLGHILYTAADRPDMRLNLPRIQNGEYHSLLGDREKARGTFRETVVYDSDQVYPEYIVIYRRVYE